MRDPHVVALHYRLETGPQLAFNDPAPVERETDSFTLRLDNGNLRVEMKEHFATADAACLEAKPYLQSWEIATDLKHGPGAMRFIFERPEMIDRDPPPPGASVVVSVVGVSAGTSVGVLVAVLISRQYPDPPDKFKALPDVVAMWERYEGFLAGKEPLPSMAYYCVMVVQHTGAGKTINRKVLSHLRYLSTMVGTRETLRKRQEGQELRQHTPEETAWMKAVVKRIIQRVGECAADPNAKWSQITMEGLPKL